MVKNVDKYLRKEQNEKGIKHKQVKKKKWERFQNGGQKIIPSGEMRTYIIKENLPLQLRISHQEPLQIPEVNGITSSIDQHYFHKNDLTRYCCFD